MKQYLAILFAILIALLGTLFFLRWRVNIGASKTTPTNKSIVSPVSTPSSAVAPDTLPTAPFHVPILMYHYIRDYTDPADKIGINLSVSPSTFEGQLKYLEKEGYTTVNLDYLLHPAASIKKPIILTFDDGYADAYSAAFPLLKQYKMVGNFYIVTGFVGRSGYLTWDEIKTMRAGGIFFGAHTVTHTDLVKSTPERLNQEITKSKEQLEAQLGESIVHFCYPSGKYNAATISALEAAGYKSATTVKSGVASSSVSLFEEPRLRITNETNLAAILK